MSDIEERVKKDCCRTVRC